MTDEILLGFDVRPTAVPAGLWDPARRALFLLRIGVAQPLSVDNVVWPSVFDTGLGAGLPAAERLRLGLAGIPAPPYTGPNAGIWEDADAMLGYLRQRRPSPAAQCAVIAISWLDDRLTGPGPYGPHAPAGSAARPAPEWQRLGYDVADGSLLSGLTNCGYRADEAETLRARWAPQLNERHLFDDPADAGAFSRQVAARVAEHAPFFVYGIYQVQEL